MRKKEFDNAVHKPITIRDSRFGIRQLFTNTKEKPRIATYRLPGKGVNGESQN